MKRKDMEEVEQMLSTLISQHKAKKEENEYLNQTNTKTKEENKMLHQELMKYRKITAENSRLKQEKDRVVAKINDMILSLERLGV